MNHHNRRLHLAGKDPIFMQLLEYGWPRVFATFIVVYVIVLLPVVLSWSEGNLINHFLKIDALHDIGYFNQFAILLPFLILFIPYYLNGLEDALISLKDRQVVMITDKEYEDFSDTTNGIFSHYIVTFSPYCIAISIYVVALFSYWLAGHNTWNSPAKGYPFTTAAILSTVPTIILYHLLSGFLFRVAALCLVIRRYLSHNVIIHPLHPDKAGGLSPLNKFSLRITAAGIFIGICCVVGIAASVYQYGLKLIRIENILIIIFYIVGLSIVFFVPLLSARKGMVKAKKRILQLISDRFNIAVSEAMAELEKDKASPKFDVNNIEELTKLYKIADRMPVYPFNIENVLKFSSSVLWPLVLIFLQWIITK